MNQWREQFNELMSINKRIENKVVDNLLSIVSERMQDKKFYVAIVGEFKRGKSTFVNSLIGKDLLPTDILPTTAVIHILEYAKEEYIEVVRIDGTSEKKELTREYLNQLTAEHQEDTTTIKYVKIYMNHSLLETGLVLIDTPGVNDICQTRVEVTKNILPYADAVIFLLDAVAALTRSEAEFLTTQILGYKLDSLLFVLSKADRLDDEELEEALEGASERILEVIENESAQLIPYSSIEVMKQSSKGQINFSELMNYIEVLRISAEAKKDERQIAKLELAHELIKSDLITHRQLLELQGEQLQVLKDTITCKIQKMDIKFEMFLQSIEKVGRETLQKMFEISFEKFLERIEQDIRDNLCMDNNVSRYWEKGMPIYIERQVRQYTEQTSRSIYQFLKKLSLHINKEYKQHFNLDMRVNMQQIGVELPSFIADKKIGNDQSSEVLARMLPITTGMIIGSLFMPGIGTILGSAAGQFIGANLRESKEEELRNQLLEQLKFFLHSQLGCYKEEGERVIDKACDKLSNHLQQVHMQNVQQVKHYLDIGQQMQEHQVSQDEKKVIEDLIVQLNN